jgi:hypothetical protein
MTGEQSSGITQDQFFQDSMGIHYSFISPKMDVAIADCPIND